MSNPFYGQLVIVSQGGEARDRLIERLRQRFRDDYVGVGGYVQPLNMGPPVGWPVQYRVSGPDIEQVRSQAMALAAILDANPNIGQVIYDWNEPGKVLKIDIAQDKVRQFGLSSEDVAQILNSLVSGTTITQVRDSTYLIDRSDVRTATNAARCRPCQPADSHTRRCECAAAGVRHAQLRAGTAAGVAA